MKLWTATKQNRLIALTVLTIVIAMFFAMFGVLSNESAYAYTEDYNLTGDAQTFTKPSNLAELQAAAPEDIATLSVYDGREYDIVTSVKNQGNEGLCWSYAALAAMETNILRKGFTTKDNIDLDEVSLAYCVFGEDYNHGVMGSYVGGIASHWYGMNVQGTGTSNDGESNSGYIMTSLINVNNNVASMKKAIATYGAVTINFKSDRTGSEYYYASSTFHNHAALIVGWDDTVSKDMFGDDKPQIDGAWIVKNSWGEGYGYAGYHYFSYASIFSGIQAFECERSGVYDHNYYQDTITGGTEQLGYRYYGAERELLSAAGSVFQVESPSSGATQVLKAVNFAAFIMGYKDTFYTIDVYTDVDLSVGEPTAGTLRSTTIYHPTFEGYHTVLLDEPITLETDDYFSVVITTNGQLYTDCYENRERPASYYWDGSKWETDTDLYGRYSAVRIKAWTCDVPTDYDSIKTDLSDATINFGENSFTYNGQEHRPEVTVNSDGDTLLPNVDYIIEYKNNLHAGTATVVIRGQGYYSGTAEKTFTIEKAQQPPNAPEAEIIVPAESIINVVLPLGWTYSNFTGTASALMTEGSSAYATMNYAGDDASDYETVSVTVKLTRGVKGSKPITTCTFCAEDIYYSGMVTKPTITVEDNGVTLVEGTDYYVGNVSAVNAGDDYYVTVYGLGNYYHYKSVKFVIRKATAVAPQNVTIAWDTSVKDINWGYGWTLKEGKVDIPAGASKTVTLVYFDTENYENTEVQVNVTRGIAPDIEIKNIDDCDIELDSESFDYTGSVIKPNITVTHGDYLLKKGIDYVLLYENNVRGGTAKVTVKGIVNYTGSKVYTYTIAAPACYHNGMFTAITVSATCTTDGYTAYTCALCNEYSFIADRVMALGHEYLSKYNFSAEGHWYECSRCGHRDSFAGHSSSGTATTTTAEICTVCNYVINDAIGHKHSFILTSAKEPTCTASGNIAYNYCTTCYNYYCADGTTQILYSSTTIASLGGHNYSTTEWGSDSNYHWHPCEVCGSQGTVSMHDWNDNQTYCPTCGYGNQSSHTHTLTSYAANPATCTENGNIAYWYCGDCGKLFSDSNAENEISLDDTVIRKAGHNLSEEWANNSNEHWHECTVCGDKKDIANHNAGAEATETEPQICTVCNYVIHEALGHTHSLTLIAAKTATCTETGNIGYYACRCGKLFSDVAATREISIEATVIPKSEHSYNNGVCTMCGENGNEQQPPIEEEHVCLHACEHCGKCLDETCGERECADKCQGHSDIKPNTSDKPKKADKSSTLVTVIAVATAIIVLTVVACVLIKRRKR